MSMKKVFKKVVAFALATVVAATAVVGMTACKKDNSDTIKIGFSGPLTGDAAVYGIAVRNSAKLAVDEINAIEEAGGEGTLGIKFELMFTDDKHDANLVANNYATMYENGMQISLGAVTTGPALEFKELAKEDNVFVLTPSASGDAVPEYDNAYQMCFADSNQGTASAEYFNTNYAGKTVGVFFKSDDEYSVGIKNKFLESLSSSFTVKQASFMGDAANFSSQVQELKDCDVIFMPIYYTPASQFMMQAKNDVKANAVYFGCDGLDGIASIPGFDINSITQEVSFLTHFDSSKETGAAAEFVAKYNAAYDEAKEPINQFGASAYDCVYAIYEALKFAKANGVEFSAETSASEFCEILKAVFNNDSFVFHGVTGAPEANGLSNISWTDNGFVNKVAEKSVVKGCTAE